MSTQSISVRWRSAGACAALPPSRHSSDCSTNGQLDAQQHVPLDRLRLDRDRDRIGRQLRLGGRPRVLADVGDGELRPRRSSSPASQPPSVSQKRSSARAMRRRSSVVNLVGWEKSSVRTCSAGSPGDSSRSTSAGSASSGSAVSRCCLSSAPTLTRPRPPQHRTPGRRRRRVPHLARPRPRRARRARRRLGRRRCAGSRRVGAGSPSG